MTLTPLGPTFDIVTGIHVIGISDHHDGKDIVNENVMKIWKRWREGMINLINYPFYFGRRGKKSHAVSVH